MISKRIQFSCGWCGKENELIPSEYKKRMEQSKSGLLFCKHGVSKCASSYRTEQRRNVKVLSEPTVSIRILDEPVQDDWFEDFEKEYKNQFYSNSNSFIGGSFVTTDNTIVGGSNFNSKENGRSMEKTMGEIIAAHPEMVTMGPDEFQKKLAEIRGEEAKEEEPVAKATPIVKPRIVTNPVVSSDSKLVQPRVRENVASRWQDSLNNKDRVADCDAEFWDAECTMKKCNFHPVEKTYKYCVIDDASGEIDFTSRPCYRCQGKGYLTEANIGYNFDSDMKRSIIASTITWEEYLSRYSS